MRVARRAAALLSAGTPDTDGGMTARGSPLDRRALNTWSVAIEARASRVTTRRAEHQTAPEAPSAAGKQRRLHRLLAPQPAGN